LIGHGPWDVSPSGGAALDPLPSCTIKVWREGVFTKLIKSLRCVPLFLGAFALAAERSSLSDCLAAATISEDFEPLPELAETKEESDLRRGGETPFGGT